MGLRERLAKRQLKQMQKQLKKVEREEREKEEQELKELEEDLRRLESPVRVECMQRLPSELVEEIMKLVRVEEGD